MIINLNNHDENIFNGFIYKKFESIEKSTIFNLSENEVYDFFSDYSAGSFYSVIVKEDYIYIITDHVSSKPFFFINHSNVLYLTDVYDFSYIKKFNLTFDVVGVSFFITMGMIPGEKTLFNEVQELLPGSIYKYSKISKKIVSKKRYWEFSRFEEKRNKDQKLKDYHYVVNNMFQRMEDYVKKSNKKFFLPISAGLDSRLIAYHLKSYEKDSYHWYSSANFSKITDADLSTTKDIEELSSLLNLKTEYFDLMDNKYQNLYENNLPNKQFFDEISFGSLFRNYSPVSFSLVGEKIKSGNYVVIEGLLGDVSTGGLVVDDYVSIIKSKDVFDAILRANGILKNNCKLYYDEMKSYLQSLDYAKTKTSSILLLDRFNMEERSFKKVNMSYRYYAYYNNDFYLPYMFDLEFLNFQKKTKHKGLVCSKFIY